MIIYLTITPQTCDIERFTHMHTIKDIVQDLKMWKWYSWLHVRCFLKRLFCYYVKYTLQALLWAHLLYQCFVPFSLNKACSYIVFPLTISTHFFLFLTWTLIFRVFFFILLFIASIVCFIFLSRTTSKTKHIRKSGQKTLLKMS